MTPDENLIEDFLVEQYNDLVKKVKATKQRQIHYCNSCKCLEICKEGLCDFRCDYYQKHGYCIAKEIQAKNVKR